MQSFSVSLLCFFVSMSLCLYFFLCVPSLYVSHFFSLSFMQHFRCDNKKPQKHHSLQWPVQLALCCHILIYSIITFHVSLSTCLIFSGNVEMTPSQVLQTNKHTSLLSSRFNHDCLPM